jgi:hypothetical protein
MTLCEVEAQRSMKLRVTPWDLILALLLSAVKGAIAGAGGLIYSRPLATVIGCGLAP